MDVLEVIETYSLQQLKSSNKSCKMYSDKKDRSPQLETKSLNKKGELTIEIQSEGAVIITN